MTGPQWDEAFDVNDPEQVGRRVWEAIQEAIEEDPNAAQPTWDAVDPATRQIYVRAGQILQDKGVSRTAADTTPTDETEQGGPPVPGKDTDEGGESDDPMNLDALAKEPRGFA